MNTTASNGISIVIPAYNEEKYLPDCLKSINTAREFLTLKTSLASEVILVNNDSTDQTKKVAISLGATVIDHKFVIYQQFVTLVFKIQPMKLSSQLMLIVFCNPMHFLKFGSICRMTITLEQHSELKF